jgi:hypothetical protein
MPALLRPVLLALVWSLGLVVARSFILGQNPFVGSVLMILSLFLLVGQVVAIRKRGLAYISIFIGCFLAFFILLSFVGDHINYPVKRRYYAKAKQ